MGLTSWRGTRVRKSDIGIAKNYLSKKEIEGLNDLVEQYLVFAQTQAKARKPMTMRNWIEKLHGFSMKKATFWSYIAQLAEKATLKAQK